MFTFCFHRSSAHAGLSEAVGCPCWGSGSGPGLCHPCGQQDPPGLGAGRCRIAGSKRNNP